MQPVYVAISKVRGWTTLNRLIIVPATHSHYERICRILESNPSQPVKIKSIKGYLLSTDPAFVARREKKWNKPEG
jgi:uncharacterized protein YhdP